MFSSLSFSIALLGLSLMSPVFSQFIASFAYGTEKVRGVNLGGWLVLEVRVLFFSLLARSHHGISAMDHPESL